MLPEKFPLIIEASIDLVWTGGCWGWNWYQFGGKYPPDVSIGIWSSGKSVCDVGRLNLSELSTDPRPLRAA